MRFFCADLHTLHQPKKRYDLFAPVALIIALSITVIAAGASDSDCFSHVADNTTGVSSRKKLSTLGCSSANRCTGLNIENSNKKQASLTIVTF